MALSLSEYADQDGMGLAALVRSGQVSATELMAAALASIEQLNPKLNAVTHTMRPEAEAMIAAGLPDGPYTGVPFLLKDCRRRWRTCLRVPAAGSSAVSSGLTTPNWYDDGSKPGW